MIETLDAVFLEGSIFETVLAGPASAERHYDAAGPLPRIHVAVSDAGNEVGFITCKVMRNLRKRCVFHAGGVPVMLWGEPPSEYKEELRKRLQNVASVTKERLIADFPQNDIRSHLAIFDSDEISKAFGPLPDCVLRRKLLRSVRQFAIALGVEKEAAVLQYNGVIPHMLEQMKPSKPLAGRTNSEAWTLLALCRG